MARAEVVQQTTQLNAQNGEAVNRVQSLRYDENVLPTPQELEQYKAIDPKIVDFLIESSKSEQQFRHDIEYKKMKIVSSSDSGQRWMNWWGMFFAFVSLVALVGLSAYALYLDKPWFAGFLGGSSIVATVSIFVKRDRHSEKSNTTRKK